MKTLGLLILPLMIAVAGCSLKPQHSVRIANSYPETLNNVAIDNTQYGSIASGTVTDYKPIDEGSHNVSGTAASGASLSGTLSLQGKGKHKWTLTILSNGGVAVKED